MQKYAHLVELEKCFQTHIFLQNFVLRQPRTSPPKFLQNFANFIFPILLTLTLSSGADEHVPDSHSGGVVHAAVEVQDLGRDARDAAVEQPVLLLLHRLPDRLAPRLKGSIGEGPNHSNFSDRSSVRILGIQRKPRNGQNSFKN